MGWFSYSDNTAAAEPKPTKADGIAPNRSQRARCWEARDAFFQCLEANGIIDSMKNKDLASEKCGKKDIEFGKECVASWVCNLWVARFPMGYTDISQVDYFKKRRVMEYKKEQMLKELSKEDAVKIGVPLPPPKA